jgi:hypothetical protein
MSARSGRTISARADDAGFIEWMFGMSYQLSPSDENIRLAVALVGVQPEVEPKEKSYLLFWRRQHCFS